MAIDKNAELVVADDVPAIIDDNLVAIADAAERRVEAINRIKRAALAVTNAHDWIDQNGRPYLQASGAEKIARLFGISWRIDEPVMTREEDGHFSYTYKGYFSLGSATVEVIGARGSRDPFFSRRHGQDLPPSEIDRNDVKKAAFTNLLGNGITRILGIRNLTWEDVNTTGISQQQVSKVEYQQAESSPEAQGLRQRIEAMILEIVGGDAKKAEEYLENITSFTTKDGKAVRGKRRTSELSDKAAPVTYQKVKRAYEAWQKAHGKEERPDGNGNGAGGSLFDEQPA